MKTLQLHIIYRYGNAYGIVEGHSVSLPILNPEIMAKDLGWASKSTDDSTPYLWPGTWRYRDHGSWNDLETGIELCLTPPTKIG